MSDTLVVVGLVVWAAASVGYGLIRRWEEIKETRKRAREELRAARRRARLRVQERDVEEPS